MCVSLSSGFAAYRRPRRPSGGGPLVCVPETIVICSLNRALLLLLPRLTPSGGVLDFVTVYMRLSCWSIGIDAFGRRPWHCDLQSVGCAAVRRLSLLCACP